MDVGMPAAAPFLLGLVIVALTAACIVAVSVSSIRANQSGWELLGELVVVSVLVPVGLTYAATQLPPELFEFLR